MGKVFDSLNSKRLLQLKSLSLVFILIIFILSFIIRLSFSQIIAGGGTDKQASLIVRVIKVSDPFDTARDVRRIEIIGFYTVSSGYLQILNPGSTHPAFNNQMSQPTNIVQGSYAAYNSGNPSISQEVYPLSNVEVKVFYADEGSTSSTFLQSIILDSNGMGILDIGNILTFPKKCRTYMFHIEGTQEYSGITEQVKVCKVSSDMIDFRQTIIDFFSSNPLSLLTCIPMFILLGVLFAANFASGVNPLRFWDINTPRLPKARISRVGRLPMMGGFWELMKVHRRMIKEHLQRIREYRENVNRDLEGARRTIRDLERQINDIRNSNLSQAEKNARIRELQNRINELRADMNRINETLRALETLSRLNIILSFLMIGTDRTHGMNWAGYFYLNLLALRGNAEARELLRLFNQLRRSYDLNALKSEHFRRILNDLFEAQRTKLLFLTERLTRTMENSRALLERSNASRAEFDQLCNAHRSARNEIDVAYHRLRRIIENYDNLLNQFLAGSRDFYRVNHHERSRITHHVNDELERLRRELNQLNVDTEVLQKRHKQILGITGAERDLDRRLANDEEALAEEITRRRDSYKHVLSLLLVYYEYEHLSMSLSEYNSPAYVRMRLLYENAWFGLFGALYSMPVVGKTIEGSSYFTIWGIGSTFLGLENYGKFIYSPFIAASLIFNNFSWYRSFLNHINSIYQHLTNYVNQNLYSPVSLALWPGIRLFEWLKRELYDSHTGFIRPSSQRIGHILDPDLKSAKETVVAHEVLLREYLEYVKNDLQSINSNSVPGINDLISRLLNTIETYKRAGNSTEAIIRSIESQLSYLENVLRINGMHEQADRILNFLEFFNQSTILVRGASNLEADGISRMNSLNALRALMQNNQDIRNIIAMVKALVHMKFFAEPSLMENWMITSDTLRGNPLIENEETRRRMNIDSTGRELRDLIENDIRQQLVQLMRQRNARSINEVMDTPEFQRIVENAGQRALSIIAERVVAPYILAENPGMSHAEAVRIAERMLRSMISSSIGYAYEHGQVKGGRIQLGAFSISRDRLERTILGNIHETNSGVNIFVGSLLLSYTGNIEKGLALRTVRARLFHRQISEENVDSFTNVYPEPFHHEFGRRFLAEFATTMETFSRGYNNVNKIIEHNIALLDAYYNPERGVLAVLNPRLSSALQAALEGSATQEQINEISKAKKELMKSGLNLVNMTALPWIASLGGYYFPALEGGALIIYRDEEGRTRYTFERDPMNVVKAINEKKIVIEEQVDGNKVKKVREVKDVINITPFSTHAEAPISGMPIIEIVVPVTKDNGEVEYRKMAFLMPYKYGKEASMRREMHRIIEELAAVYGIDREVLNTYIRYMRLGNEEGITRLAEWYSNANQREREQIAMLLHIEREARLITGSTSYTMREISEQRAHEIVQNLSQRAPHLQNELNSIVMHTVFIRSQERMARYAELVMSEMGQGQGYRMLISRELPSVSYHVLTNQQGQQTPLAIVNRNPATTEGISHGVAKLRYVHLTEAMSLMADNPSTAIQNNSILIRFTGNLFGLSLVALGANSIVLNTFAGVLQSSTNIQTLERAARYSMLQVLDRELDYLYNLGAYSEVAYNIRFYRDLYQRYLEIHRTLSREQNLTPDQQQELALANQVLEIASERGRYYQRLSRHALGMYAAVNDGMFNQHITNNDRNWRRVFTEVGRGFVIGVDYLINPAFFKTIQARQIFTFFYPRFSEEERRMMRELRTFHSFRTVTNWFNNINNTLMMRERYHGTLADPYQIHEYALYTTWGGSGHWDIEMKQPYVHVGPYGGGMFIRNKTWFVSVGMYDWMRKFYSPLFHMAEMAATTTKPFIKAGMGWGNVYDERDHRINMTQVWRNIVYDIMFSPLTTTKSFLYQLPLLPISPIYSYKKYIALLRNSPEGYFYDTGTSYEPIDSRLIQRAWNRGYSNYMNRPYEYMNFGSALPDERSNGRRIWDRLINSFMMVSPFNAKKWELQHLTGYHEYYFEVPLDPFQFVVPHNIRMMAGTPGLAYTDMFGNRNLVQRMGYALMQGQYAASYDVWHSATDYQIWRQRTHSAVENYIHARDAYWEMYKPTATLRRNPLLVPMFYSSMVSSAILPFGLELFPLAAASIATYNAGRATYYQGRRAGLALYNLGRDFISIFRRTPLPHVPYQPYSLGLPFGRIDRVACARCGSTMNADAYSCPACGARYRY